MDDKVSFPLISIITVVYNASSDLESTILSVINQTYPNIEYIIIDGGSTDGTIDIIRKYNDHITYCISEPDNGIYDAMNKGIDRATGVWLNFMNAGDNFQNENVLKNIFEDTLLLDNADIIYGSVSCVRGSVSVQEYPKDLYDFRKKIPFCHQAAFVKRTVIPHFDTRLKICADYDSFYSLYKAGYNFKEINECVAHYDENGFSRKNVFAYMKENYLIRRKYSNKSYALYIYIRDLLSYFATALGLKK